MAARISDEEDEPEVRALLLIDILGTKSVWSDQGRDGATDLFDRFARLVRDELRGDPSLVESGAIESDCAALICPDASAAVSMGIGIYRRAFFRPKLARINRLWLRGVIVPLEGPAGVQWLRTSAPLADDLAQVSVETYSGDLLDAISMEKAGFRGMRLLLDPSLRTAEVRRDHRLSLPARDGRCTPSAT